ncbi:MAG TPA: preprotein translocase subunit SecG [Methylomirabilota bacterium]|nr:preprotein translocase subunit SecG [Methylomirabilota bacterium]
MIWIIGFLTFLLVVDCLFLILLVLVQLPKKEAGLGQAFGASATDALFGAGSGNALTKMTKYTAVVFFALTLSLSMLNARQARSKSGDPRLRLTPAERAEATPLRPTPTNADPQATTTNLAPTAATNGTTSPPAPSTPATNK